MTFCAKAATSNGRVNLGDGRDQYRGALSGTEAYVLGGTGK